MSTSLHPELPPDPPEVQAPETPQDVVLERSGKVSCPPQRLDL